MRPVSLSESSQDRGGDTMTALRGSDTRLCDRYDVALLDLDGVVYVGPDAVPGAPKALAAARAAGMQLAFVTNNAARPPDVVAAHLTDLGIAAVAGEVITSAQAAARYLAERLPASARVLVLGTVGLEVALRERGLTPVSDATGEVAAVVQGYSPDMNWQLLAEGAVAINRGALWVATNIDPTVPSPRGPLPGNGSLVAALQRATRADPIVTGKPDPTMHRETMLRTEAQHPIVVGDRLDTDIEGANAVGCASLLVFSGVTTVSDLLAAEPALRPTYLAADVGGLLHGHPEIEVSHGSAACGAWSVRRGGEGLRLVRRGDPSSAAESSHQGGSGAHDNDSLDAVRALCAAAWQDRDGSPHATAAAGDVAAAEVLDKIGLGRV